MNDDRKIRVLVVDDSPVARELLVHIFNSDPQLSVVATAASGAEAIQSVALYSPDVVTMDVIMPGLNGFETTRAIMETQPLPVVIVSGAVDPRESAVAFQALEAGALAVIERPVGLTHPDYESAVRKLVQIVKAMSEVVVVRRRPKRGTAPPKLKAAVKAPGAHLRVVAIAASTGGPPVLETVLQGLTSAFPIPVLIVQHISAGFLEGLAAWLTQTTEFPVHIARQGERIKPGRALIAPDGFHMGVDRRGRIVLSDEPPDQGLRPSAAHLFRSVAAAYGSSAVGVLLTGMGRDGADELKLMRSVGAVTIAQDKESSVVHGMPGEAIRLDAAVHILPPARIAATLRSLVVG